MVVSQPQINTSWIEKARFREAHWMLSIGMNIFLYWTSPKGIVDLKIIETLNLGSNSCSGLLWSCVTLHQVLNFSGSWHPYQWEWSWYNHIQDLPNHIRFNYIVKVNYKASCNVSATFLSSRKCAPAIIDNLDLLLLKFRFILSQVQMLFLK